MTRVADASYSGEIVSTEEQRSMAHEGVPPLVQFFESIDDPRRDNANRRHKLVDIIVVAVTGMICGCDSWTEIEMGGNAKEAWFRTFLELPGGIPSHDTFGRVFSMIDPAQFREAFGHLVAAIAQQSKKEVVAIDGKTVRRSHDRSVGQDAIHMVSAFAVKNRVVLGQVKTDQKSNEITAIPKLLQALSLKDVVVTIDAMGCQKNIIEKIVAGGGDYVIGLKGNQPTLHEDADHYFDASILDDFKTGNWSIHESDETGHGRHERRTCYVSGDLSNLSTADDWKKLKSLVVVVSERTVDGLTSTERRLYVSSLKYKARRFSEIVRSHWGIENSLHWVLDMAFREDECRVRKGNAAENLVVLRHLATNLLRRTPTEKYRAGVKAKRIAAAMDHDYLLDVLSMAGS